LSARDRALNVRGATITSRMTNEQKNAAQRRSGGLFL
jgi:hypothetical protein